MKIHHVKPHEIKWMPLTYEVRQLPLQKNKIYILTNGDDTTCFFHVRTSNPSLEYSMRNPKYTHLAIIKLPESADELPTYYEDYQVVTDEEETRRAKFDKPVGSFVEVDGKTYVIEEGGEGSCNGCGLGTPSSTGRHNSCPHNYCYSWNRSDGKNVIYRPVMSVDCGPLEKGGEQ